MEKIATTYQPLACSLYDQLEAFATKRELCKIVFHDDDQEKEIEGTIVDLFSKDGVEFLKLNNGQAIRLDHLVAVNGISMNKTC